VNAFVTLVTNDDYALGALALIRSLKGLDVQIDLVPRSHKPGTR